MLPINITEHNAAMWGLRQDEIDLVHGRSEYQKRVEMWREWKQEKCMSGTVFETDDSDVNRKIREFTANFVALRKDAAIVKDFLVKRSGTDVFVRVDGTLFNLTQNYGATWELPVNVREATVIE